MTYARSPAPNPMPPLAPRRKEVVVALIGRMLWVAKVLFRKHRNGTRISSRGARLVSKQIQLVEYAVRRLLVLIAFPMELAPLRDSPPRIQRVAPKYDKTPKKAVRFSLSELPRIPSNGPINYQSDAAPFWEALRARPQGAISFRKTDPLIHRLEAIAYVMDNLQSYALRMAKLKRRAKARNIFGVPVFASPAIPMDRKSRREIGQSDWREFCYLHSQATALISGWGLALRGLPP